MDSKRKNDDQESEADKYFAKIKDVNNLGFLKRRPRCPDGSLDIRMKVNRKFDKYEYVTDYYHPENPDVEVTQASIDQALRDQQEEFEKIRFKELAAQKAKLDRKEQLRKEQ